MDEEYATVEIKKLYQGRAEIRSYQFTEIRRFKKGIKFVLNGEERYVSAEETKKGKAGISIKAKFPLANGATTYRLIGWDWDKLPEERPVVSQQSFNF